MSDIVYLTKEKIKQIEEELNDLKTRGRREVAVKIADARSHGDLSENADYDAAREEQGLLELKISKLSQTLSKSQVIDNTEFPSDKVYILSKVKLLNLANNSEISYYLVSAEEADYENNKIAVSSVVGKSLLGKSLGEEVTITLPHTTLHYKIIEISR